MLTPDRLTSLAAQLLEADADADPVRLAGLAWELYGDAGAEHAEAERLRAALHCALRTAQKNAR
jgi:hypothetical protein